VRGGNRVKHWLAKVCNQRDSLGCNVLKVKARGSSGRLSAARCSEKAKELMGRGAYGRRRPLSKRIMAPPVSNGADYRGFRRREVAELKQYLDHRYEGGIAGDMVVRFLNFFFNKLPDILSSVG
jgi:hypothetical protein